MAMCENCKYENVCEMPAFIRNGIKKCKVFEERKPQKPQTNADKIRSMSDAELAEFINTVANDSIDMITAYGTKSHTEIWEDKEPTMQWLQSEAE